jgi:hypothetical protein
MSMNEPTEITNSDIDPKPYLDYMDKEMTFCGIITTFSLACVLFMMDKMFSSIKTNDTTIQIDFKSIYFLMSIISLVIAAFLLFKLRANLAYNYGQISLEITSKGFTGKPIESWLKDVDSWEFWNPYFYAIALIICAFIQIAIFLFINFYKINLNYYWSLLVLVFSIIGGYITIKKYDKES